MPDIRLPDETLYLIFKNLNPFELTKVETVCKHWKALVRSHHSLWRDGLFIGDCQGYKPDPGKKPKFEESQVSLKVLTERLKVLCERTKGTVENLGFYLSLVELVRSSKQDVKNMTKYLINSGVVNLWIEIKADRPSARRTKGQYEKPFVRNQTGKLIQFVLGAVSQCPNLQSLHLQAEDLNHQSGEFPLLQDTPLMRCRLKRLTLNGVILCPLFLDPPFKICASQARVIEFCDNMEFVPAEKILPLLDHCKDSLEEFRVRMIEKAILNGPQAKANRVLTFPHLFRLDMYSINYDLVGEIQHDAAKEDEGVQLQDPYTFYCPNLRHLCLFDYIIYPVYESLLTDKIEFLDIKPRRNIYIPVARLLKRCTNLKTFIFHFPRLEFGGPIDTQAVLKEIGKNIQDLPIEELCIFNSKCDGMEIVNMIKENLQSKSPNAKKIKVVRLVCCQSVTKENHLWIKRNVGDLRIFDYDEDVQIALNRIDRNCRNVSLLEHRAYINEEIKMVW